MNTLLIGNIICFIGATLMVLIGFIKTKKNIIIAQNAQFVIMGIGNLVLGGVTGAISNAVSIVRNVVVLKTELTVGLKCIFILIQIILGAAFNNLGWIGWFPIIAACIFTWFLDTKNEVLLKAVIIGTEVLWIAFDFAIKSYTSMAFDAFTIASNFVGIIMIQKTRSQIDVIKE